MHCLEGSCALWLALGSIIERVMTRVRVQLALGNSIECEVTRVRVLLSLH